METPRKAISSFLLMGLLCVWFATAQDVTHENSTGLRVVGTGHIITKGRPLTLYRRYEAPDGTEASAYHTEFDSPEAAEQQIEKWVKVTATVTSREHDQRKGGKLISDRI